MFFVPIITNGIFKCFLSSFSSKSSGPFTIKRPIYPECTESSAKEELGVILDERD